MGINVSTTVSVVSGPYEGRVGQVVDRVGDLVFVNVGDDAPEAAHSINELVAID